ncbi:S41 family peptidase [Belliella kenyensis]|uniref:S41 family peptidase n=1 Tax=Belliella kenyensis TaxID=1472724 RepID=A0ABV8EMI5_9BACT|nr:S41 family peptidase [Belliella kenyensis]MCH7400308.1 S41 family peptidase [Belliella kenyensis]MDN3604674.1 S41 family peptidase [Belliella kenyensis]
MNIRFFPQIILLVFTFGFICSCNPKEENPDPAKVDFAVQNAIVESMKRWYFWNERIPENIDVTRYTSNEALLDAIIFKDLDRWSYITTREAFNASFQGTITGAHGFGFSLLNDRMYISFVYNEAPAGKDGWKRGWEVVEINGKPISEYRTSNGFNFQLGPNEVGYTNSFKLKLPDGSEKATTISKAQFQSNSVLYSNVLLQNDKKVGYWVYQSFRQTPGLTNPVRSQEVEDTFSYFSQEDIDELIIDLRYNGGGSVAVTEQILNYLVPQANSGQVMYTNRHNAPRSNNNRSVNFSKRGNLNLSRIIFITSRGSASASELLINCLDPYVEVILIGDNTYGKPVGSFPLSFDNRLLREKNVEVVPITFAIDNANGRADYFEGFPVNFPVPDDPSKDWGDLAEARLGAALQFITTGSVSSGRLTPQSSYFQWHMIDDFEGLWKEFPVY